MSGSPGYTSVHCPIDKRRTHRTPRCRSHFLVVNQEFARKREEKSRKDKNRVASYNAAQRQNQNVRKPWVAHINAELNTASEAAAVAEAATTATATTATPVGAATAAAAAGGAAVVVGGAVPAMAAVFPPAASGAVGVVTTAGVVGLQEGAQSTIASAAVAQPAPPATA